MLSLSLRCSSSSMGSPAAGLDAAGGSDTAEEYLYRRKLVPSPSKAPVLRPADSSIPVADTGHGCVAAHAHTDAHPAFSHTSSLWGGSVLRPWKFTANPLFKPHGGVRVP